MGIIRRQAIWNALFSYIGIGLGAVNVMLLMPRFMDEQEQGFIILTTQLTLLLSMLASMGLPATFIRFLPQTGAAARQTYRFLLKVLLLSITLFTVTYVLCRPLLTAIYQEKSPVFPEHYLEIIPFFMSMAVFLFFEAVLTTALRTTFTLFLKEVLLRLLTLLGIILLGLGWLDYWGFFYLYMVFHLGIALLLTLLAVSVPVSRLVVPQESTRAPGRKLLVRFAIMNLTTAISFYIVIIIDTLMITALMGVGYITFYSIYNNMATVLSVPGRALGRIVQPLLAQAWVREDRVHISTLYERTSLMGIFSALGLMGLIWLNAPLVEALYIHMGKPVYASYFSLFIPLGLNAAINVAFGANHLILHTSPHYLWDTVCNILLVPLAIGLNYLLIPEHGLMGAAVASALSTLLFNLAKWAILWRLYALQPFHWRHGAVAVVLAAAFFLCRQLPDVGLWEGAFLRSLSFCLLAGVPVLYWRLIPSLNEVVRIVRAKLPGRGLS
ncbi:MAG: polysaccharide biosynthesis C-terminal domain-containing protein [Bacteroidetes bacterium]|nr:polysaccharide biosynthesis C-terminal domain-containing protein [Bacteroidota bacterium]